MQEVLVRSLGWEDPLVEEMATHSSIFAWKCHGQRSLAGYSPRGRKESDTLSSQTHTHTHTRTRLIHNAVLVSVVQQSETVIQMCVCSVAKSCPTLGDLRPAALQASLSFIISRSLLKFTSTELAMLPNHLILCLPFLLLPCLSQHQGLSQ